DFLNGRKEQADQHADDGDDDQQLDQRKPPHRPSPLRVHGCPSSFGSRGQNEYEILPRVSEGSSVTSAGLRLSGSDRPAPAHFLVFCWPVRFSIWSKASSSSSSTLPVLSRAQRLPPSPDFSKATSGIRAPGASS